MYPRNLKLVKAALLSVIMATVVSACTAERNNIAGFDPGKDMATPGSQIVFNAMNPAISMGGAYGDMSKGGHGTFGKFVADFITPFHTHTGAYHGVVISGVMTNPFEDESNPPEMGPGSYWYVPANSVHATACISDTPCQFYFYADSSFDFTPVE